MREILIFFFLFNCALASAENVKFRTTVLKSVMTREGDDLKLSTEVLKKEIVSLSVTNAEISQASNWRLDFELEGQSYSVGLMLSPGVKGYMLVYKILIHGDSDEICTSEVCYGGDPTVASNSFAGLTAEGIKKVTPLTLSGPIHRTILGTEKWKETRLRFFVEPLK